MNATLPLKVFSDMTDSEWAVLQWARSQVGVWFSSATPGNHARLAVISARMYGLWSPPAVTGVAGISRERVSACLRYLANAYLVEKYPMPQKPTLAYFAMPSSDWHLSPAVLSTLHRGWEFDAPNSKESQAKLKAHDAALSATYTELCVMEREEYAKAHPPRVRTKAQKANDRIWSLEGKVRWLEQTAWVPNIQHDLLCPDCGNTLVFRVGKYGAFYGCIQFPECTGSMDAASDGTPEGGSHDSAGAD